MNSDIIDKRLGMEIVGDEARISIGHYCNNNCLFCIEGFQRGPPRSFFEIKNELEKARAMRCTKVSLCNGELTSHPSVFRILKLCRDYNFNYVVTTNGRMFFYRQFAEKFLSFRPSAIVFSVHGPNPKVHDKLTRVPGSFEQLIKGIGNVADLSKKKEAVPFFSANFVITAVNYKHIEETAELLQKYKLTGLQLIYPYPFENAFLNKKKVFVTFENLRPYLKRAISKFGQFIKIEGVPYCMLPKNAKVEIPLRSNGEKKLVAKNKIKIKKCKNCFYFTKCEGLWRRYVEYFGVRI